jgi:hypothetical protein
MVDFSCSYWNAENTTLTVFLLDLKHPPLKREYVEPIRNDEKVTDGF